MQIIAGILGLGAVAFLYMKRAQRKSLPGRNTAPPMNGAVKAAARRYGFDRKTERHPIEAIDRPSLAIAALAQAFAALGDPPNGAQAQSVEDGLARHLRLERPAARDAATLGTWLMNSCDGPDKAVPRLAQKLRLLDQGASFDGLMNVLRDVIAAGPQKAASKRQTEALGDLAQIFRLHS